MTAAIKKNRAELPRRGEISNHGEDYPPESIESERVMLWIVPSRQTLVDQTASSID